MSPPPDDPPRPVPDLTREAIYLVGATAVGKSTVGLLLAERLGGEVLSLDSMAVYRGMDVGTAKPTAADRARVPHHLLDLVDPTEEFTLAEYLRRAGGAVADVRARGKTPIFVGGTPLYLKALLRGVFEGPPADPEFRAAVTAEAQAVGPAALHDRLAQVDPVAAAKLHPHDTRRIVRALEVYRATGVPISHLQMQFDEGRPAASCRVYQLLRPREELHRRIAARVDAMFAGGLVEEAAGLLARHGDLGKTASQAVGYREALACLADTLDRQTAIADVTARTRQFAKAQETWFRSLSEVTVVPVEGAERPDATAGRIIALIGAMP